MPIKSYLAYPASGRRDELVAALGRLQGCHVLPALNRELVVLVTDTPHEAADDDLQRALAAVAALDGLALVAGVGDAEIDSVGEEGAAHDPA